MPTLDEIHALMNSFAPLPKVEIRCGRTAWEVLRDKSLVSDLPDPNPLAAIPVNVDPDMNDGAWEITEDGEIKHSGDMTPGHRRSIYIFGVGLIGVSDEVADMVWANVDRAREAQL